MGCFPFANYHFQMGVTVMGFVEHFGPWLQNGALPHPFLPQIKNQIDFLAFLDFSTLCNLTYLLQIIAFLADIPIVQLKRDYKVVPQGSSVKLTCPILGLGRSPLITWSKGGETITDYAWTRFSLDKKSLKISQAEYDDTGIYICKGTNGYGSNEVRIDLFVIGECLLSMS